MGPVERMVRRLCPYGTVETPFDEVAHCYKLVLLPYCDEIIFPAMRSNYCLAESVGIF